MEMDLMRRIPPTLRLIAVAVFGVLSVAASARAATVIDFGTGTAGKGGSISVIGDDVVGVDIPIDVLTVIGTALDGVYDVAGDLLSSSAVGGNSAALSFDTANNTISIYGAIPSLGIATPITLLSGSFSWYSFIDAALVAAFTGSGPDTKNPELLTAILGAISGGQHRYREHLNRRPGARVIGSDGHRTDWFGSDREAAPAQKGRAPPSSPFLGSTSVRDAPVWRPTWSLTSQRRPAATAAGRISKSELSDVSHFSV
jgi:hypothetical protein